MIDVAPKGMVVLVHWSVGTGRLFLGMGKAMVCVAALFRVLRIQS